MRLSFNSGLPPVAQAQSVWRSDRWLIALVVLLAIVPLLYPPIPPLVDLPGHMGRFAVAQLVPGEPFLDRFYDYRWRLIGNLGVDLPVYLLAGLTGVEWATRIVVSAIPPLGALGLLLTYRRFHGRLSPFAFLAACFVYAGPFHAGFVNFWLGIAVGWLAIAYLFRPGPSRRRHGLDLLAVGAVLWTIHAMAWAVMSAIIFAIHWGQSDRLSPRSLARAALDALPVVIVPLILQAYWLIGMGASGGTDGWFAVRDKISALLRSLQYQDRRTGILALVAILVTAIIAGRRGVVVNRGLAFAAMAVGILFAVVPHVMMQSWAADERLAPLVWTCCLLALRPMAPSPRPLLAIALFAGLMIYWTIAYAQASDRLTSFLAVIDRVPTHSRVAYVYVGDCSVYSAGSAPSEHAASLLIGRKHAFTSQWNFAGQNLLTVHYPAAGNYQDLSRQRTMPASCAGSGFSFEGVIRDLPRNAFDYLILFDPARRNIRLPASFVLDNGSDDTSLYRIDHMAKQAGAARR